MTHITDMERNRRTSQKGKRCEECGKRLEWYDKRSSLGICLMCRASQMEELHKMQDWKIEHGYGV